MFAQAGGSLLLKTAEPFADRGHRGREKTGGGLDADLTSGLYEPEPMVIGVFHLTHQVEVASGGHTRSLSARCPALPPAGQPSPAASSDSHTSIPPGGYDVCRLFQFPIPFEPFPRFSYNVRLSTNWRNAQYGSAR